ncbi:MAG TPA: CBS domain-containing protein [Labilithrix sp.]|jgi:CBS domain-containing protein
MTDARVLPIHLRNVIEEDGVERPLQPLVHCPRRAATTDAKTCLGCARMRTVEWDPATGGEVRCMVDDATAPIRARADFAEIAARTQLHEVATRVTVCLRAGMQLSAVRDLFVARGLRCAAVIDEEARLEGVISRSDLVAAQPPEATVRDVMPARVRALPESAPVAYAIALMASEGVSEVPVVTERGELVGMWTALEALAWVSERLGYVKAPR